MARDDPFVGGGADGDPPLDGAGLHGRRAVRDPVGHVEAVGELVEHHVVTAARVARRVEHRVPDDQHRAVQVRLAEDRHRVVGDDALDLGVLAAEHQRGRVHQHGAHAGEHVERQTQQQQRRVRRDRHLDVAGQLEPAGGLPAQLDQLQQRELLEAGTLGVVEALPVGHALLEQVAPLREEAGVEQLAATAVVTGLEVRTVREVHPLSDPGPRPARPARSRAPDGAVGPGPGRGAPPTGRATAPTSSTSSCTRRPASA